MNRITDRTDHILNAEDARPDLATRFLKATGEYALAMFGAMLLAFLWMAKDVMLAPIASNSIKAIADVLLVLFVIRQVSGYKYVLVPILLALGFTGAANFIRKESDRSR